MDDRTIILLMKIWILSVAIIVTPSVLAGVIFPTQLVRTVATVVLTLWVLFSVWGTVIVIWRLIDD